MGELRISAAIWLISMATLVSVILILGRDDQPSLELPEIPENTCFSNVFIGSSLTASGIQSGGANAGSGAHNTELAAECVLHLPGITELETLLVAEYVVTWRPTTIFVEINALATDHRGIKNIPYASNLAERWQPVQHQMARSLKDMLQLPLDQKSSVRVVSTSGTRLSGAKFERKAPVIYPRLPRLEADFRKFIQFAKNHGTRVVFFWPPQFPKEAPNSKKHFLKLRSHVVSLCERLEALCWLPREHWNERYFYDRLGHFNELGAERLTADLTGWSINQ